MDRPLNRPARRHSGHLPPLIAHAARPGTATGDIAMVLAKTTDLGLRQCHAPARAQNARRSAPHIVYEYVPSGTSSASGIAFCDPFYATTFRARHTDAGRACSRDTFWSKRCLCVSRCIRTGGESYLADLYELACSQVLRHISVDIASHTDDIALYPGRRLGDFR